MSNNYIDDVIKILEKKLGKDVVRRLSDGARSEVIDVISTGLPVIDKHVIGIGGLPVGRLSEVFSDESIGKTSFLWHCLAQCQKAGGIAALAETEQAISVERAETFGVDLDKLILLEAETLESIMAAQEEFIDAIPTGTFGLIGWDSIAATPTAKEIDEGIVGDAAIGERARFLSKSCRIFAGLLNKKRVHAMWINQTRQKIGVMFGDNTVTPGGKAVSFHASLRLRLMGGTANKNDDGDHTGKDIVIQAVKNKLGPPWRKARVRLNFDTGWDADWTTFNFAKDRGAIPKGVRVHTLEIEEILDKLGWGSDIVQLEPPA